VQNTTANIPTYTGQNNAKETRWALVIGIIALIVAFIHPVAGLVLGIIAIVRSGKEHQKAALILGIIALVICGFRFFNGLFILRYIEDIFFEFYCF
jgi:cytochrome c biogenesis protein CcdA